MSVASQLSPHPMPGSSSGSVEYTPPAPTPEGPATRAQVEGSIPLVLNEVQGEVLAALGEVATPIETQRRVAHEVPNTTNHAQYTNEVLAPVVHIERPSAPEQAPSPIEAVQIVTGHGTDVLNDRYREMRIDNAA